MERAPRAPSLAWLRARLGTRRSIVISGAIYLASQIAIGAILHPLGPAAFVRAQTTFSRDEWLALADGWARAGLLGRYWGHFWLDFVHPAWYAALLVGLIARGLDRRGAGAKANALLALPLIAAAMDSLENVCHVRLLLDRPDVTQGTITVGALASNTKWLLCAASVLLAIGLAVPRPAARRGAPP
jgi:hypothetical protein